MKFKRNLINILKEGKNIDNTVGASNLLNNEYNQLVPADIDRDNECIVDIADFDMDSSDIFNSISSSNDPVWIMIDEKTVDNKKTKPVYTQISRLATLETINEVPCLSNEYASITNEELLNLKLPKDVALSNNTSSVRNLPNILRGPKTLAKSNTPFPVPFETKDNFISTNNGLGNCISEKENNENIKKNHRKRKQVHNPLIIQEESINLISYLKCNKSNTFLKKNKFNLNKREKLTKSYRSKIHCKKKSCVYDNVCNNKHSSSISVKGAVENSDSAAYEASKEQASNLNLSSEYNLFHENQFHEDYMDHFDILTDTLKENQNFNDSSDDTCYDINLNSIPNSNDIECSELWYKEPQGFTKQELSWDHTNSFYLDNPFTNYEDCLQHENTNCLTSTTKASIDNSCNKNCLLSFFNDASDDEFGLTDTLCSCLQNSFDKNEAKNLDTLLLEGTKCDTNLECHLNNDLNSSKINVPLTNASNSTIPISLSNDLEHSTIKRQNVNGYQLDQSDQLLNTELSGEVSSKCPEYIEPNNIKLSKENRVLIDQSVQEDTEVHCNYRIEFNYENKNDKHQLTEKSDDDVVTNENLNNTKGLKEAAEPLQCLLCPLTFTSKRTLALHLAGAHGGMYLILCERCGRLFNKKHIFNRHFIQCGCIKVPFSCKECNRTYRHKSSLLHHLRFVHHIENKQDTTKLYKCDLCSKVYRKYGAFEKHLGIHIHS